MADDEQQAQQDLAEATSRLSPAATAAIAAGVVIAASDPGFATASPEAAASILFSTVRFPSTLVTQIALAGVFTPRFSDLQDGAQDGVFAGWEAGRSTLVSTAQYAARKAAGNPPSPGVLAAFQDLVTGGVAEVPDEINDYGGPALMAQATAHAILNSGPLAAAVTAGHTHKTWNSRADRKVRPTHNVLDSHAWPEHTVPITDPFISPAGAELMFPGDPTAPLDEIANCRCWLTFTTPKRGQSYGEAADLATNPPQMQGNPGVVKP